MSKKLPSALYSSEKTEIVTLKRVIVAALVDGMSVSYDNRSFIVKVDEGHRLMRADAPHAGSTFGDTQTVAVVNLFLAHLEPEDAFDPEKVLIHSSSDAAGVGESWRSLKNRLTIGDLINGTGIHRSAANRGQLSDRQERSGDSGGGGWEDDGDGCASEEGLR